MSLHFARPLVSWPRGRRPPPGSLGRPHRGALGLVAASFAVVGGPASATFGVRHQHYRCIPSQKLCPSEHVGPLAGCVSSAQVVSHQRRLCLISALVDALEVAQRLIALAVAPSHSAVAGASLARCCGAADAPMLLEQILLFFHCYFYVYSHEFLWRKPTTASTTQRTADAHAPSPPPWRRRRGGGRVGG